MTSCCDFAVSRSTQITLSFSHIDYDKKNFCDVCTMTEPDCSIPFRIEQIQNDDDAVRFYTGFPTFKILMTCFIFLGGSVSKLVGRHYQSIGIKSGRPHDLSPLNEFFLMLCRLRLGLLEQDLAYRFHVSQPTVFQIISGLLFVFANLKKCHFGPLERLLITICLRCLETYTHQQDASLMPRKYSLKSQQTLAHSS